ncbi:hypothetical protein [Curtobacterium sp. 9128]|uniref:hypothetical protein n=1 Tax=Curtobacterium sp. 9128 TaxID=1793722 RepID=UPI0011A6E171|nr:hypothetical protein [Curtobacterium sp. 9128]
MGERSNARRRRRSGRMIAVVRADARASRTFGVAERVARRRFERTALVTGIAGLLWPVGLGLFASIRGSITHPPVPAHGKYRYANVATGWPDFTAPWPVPIALVLVVVVSSLLLLRHRRVVGAALPSVAFAWVTVGIGVTWVGCMYLGAAQWPHGQAALGVPVLVVGVVLWVLNRRRENRLIRAENGLSRRR